MIKSCEKVTGCYSFGISGNRLNTIMGCQCRDVPQNHVAIPLAIATINLFHNFYRLDPYFFLIIIFNILVCQVFLL